MKGKDVQRIQIIGYEESYNTSSMLRFIVIDVCNGCYLLVAWLRLKSGLPFRFLFIVF